MAFFREGFHRPERWIVSGGRLEAGGRFVSESEKARAVCALEVIKRGDKLLRLEVGKLKGTLEISACPLAVRRV